MAIHNIIISRKGKKIFNQNQIDNECVEDLLHRRTVVIYKSRKKKEMHK